MQVMAIDPCAAYRTAVEHALPHARVVADRFLDATDRHTVADRLHRFHETVLAADLPEAQKLAETIDGWWPETLGFLETRITNAGTEGTNRMVKDAARIAFGFRNLDNQRRRVRFHCTRRSRRNVSVEAAQPHQL